MPAAEFGQVAIGATAFTIALAWNEAVSTNIQAIYPKHKRGATIVYAVVITLLVVIVYAVAVRTAHYATAAGKVAKHHITKFITGFPPPGSVIAPPTNLSRPIIVPPIFDIIAV